MVRAGVVVACPYVLMPLLAFLASHFYRQGLRRIFPFVIATALLIQDRTYATVLGFGFAAFYAFQLALCRDEILDNDRKGILYAAAVIAASLILLAA